MNKKVTPEIQKLIVEKYLTGLTLVQTGELFNVTADTVLHHLIKTNTKIRNLSESHKGKFIGEDSVHYKGGKPKCLVCKKQLSGYNNKYCRVHFRTSEWSNRQKISRVGFHPRSEFKKGHKPITPFIKGHKIHLGKKASSEARKNMSYAQKEYIFNNPEVLKRMLSFNSPNKTELKFLSILNNLYPNEWKFVGDGSFVIDGKCPDFINCNGKKLIIELFGEHWHDKDEEEPRKEIFKQYGYETLIIWAKELKNTNVLEIKIKEFIQDYKEKINHKRDNL